MICIELVHPSFSRHSWFLSKATHISIWVFLFNFEPMETAKVKRAFTCVNARVHYAIGDTYESDSHRIGYLVNKGYLTAAPKAHIPKAEVAEPHKFALLSHDPATAPIAPTPKRKRNEHK